MDKFTIKHYSGEERPILKGNGFDGLEIGVEREDSQPFIDYVNRLADSLKELVCIVEIHSKATKNNFAWAELDEAKEVLEDCQR